MRYNNAFMQERALRYADLTRLSEVLDQISQTPWRINQKVLEVVEAVWEEGGGIAEIPKRYNNF